MSPPLSLSSFEYCVQYRPDALILLCRCFGKDVAHPHEVVTGQGQQPLKATFPLSTELGLSNLADLFTSAHDLLDMLAYLLADGVAVVLGGAGVDRRAPVPGVLCHVRRHRQLAQPGDE